MVPRVPPRGVSSGKAHARLGRTHAIVTRLGWGAKVGAVFGAFMAVLGATVGAIQGHEMRYELAAP